MPMRAFLLYTTIGAGIWAIILALLGYFIGGNEAVLKEYLHQIVLVTLGIIGIVTVLYVLKNKQKKL
jgi:membrane protein DedA with SNARE-associated domain